MIEQELQMMLVEGYENSEIIYVSRAFCSYKIESWQTVDFSDKVKFLKVVDSNVNYRSVKRMIRRLVEEGFNY